MYIYSIYIYLINCHVLVTRLASCYCVRSRLCDVTSHVMWRCDYEIPKYFLSCEMHEIVIFLCSIWGFIKYIPLYRNPGDTDDGRRRQYVIYCIQ